MQHDEDRSPPGGGPAADGFGVRVQRSGDRISLKLSGDLDIASAPAVEARVASFADKARSIAVDLSAVEFMDSTGLRALLACHHTCGARDCEFSVVSPSAPVKRLLALANLQGVPPFSLHRPTGAR
jgi:anti-sigma B factor antagonist